MDSRTSWWCLAWLALLVGCAGTARRASDDELPLEAIEAHRPALSGAVWSSGPIPPGEWYAADSPCEMDADELPRFVFVEAGLAFRSGEIAGQLRFLSPDPRPRDVLVLATTPAAETLPLHGPYRELGSASIEPGPDDLESDFRIAVAAGEAPSKVLLWGLARTDDGVSYLGAAVLYRTD